MAGYSGTPLPKKLGIKEGHRVGTYSAPPSFSGALGQLPPSVRLEAEPSDDKGFDVLVLFVLDLEQLEVGLRGAIPSLKWDGGLWVGWPKRSSELAGEVRESHVRSAGLESGLVDNKVCAIDQDWSGLRFVYRRVDRPSPKDR